MILKSNNISRLVPASSYIGQENEKPLVSVCVGTHNQKEYVSQCLDSILSQLVNFKIEILINDDASTDGTQTLLKEYQKKYPGIIKIYFEKENQFSKNHDYSYVYKVHAPRISGKYVALLDSDDYYCNPMNLYLKVNALEKNANCKMCLSRVRKIDNRDSSTICLMPKFSLRTGIISSNKLLKMLIQSYCFQTSSYFFRALDYIDFCNNYPQFAKKIKVFDEPVIFYFGTIGNAYYINEVFSVYRKFSTDSWSVASLNKNTHDMVQRLSDRVNFVNEFDIYTKNKFHKQCQKRIAHSKIHIYLLEHKECEILKNKSLSAYFRKHNFKDYICIKYFKNWRK